MVGGNESFDMPNLKKKLENVNEVFNPKTNLEFSLQ